MSDNQFDSIDFCCDMLYDYMYNEKVSESFEYQNIILDDITINDIKKTPSFDYSEVLSGDLKYIGSLNNQFMFTKISKNNKKYMIVIGKYDSRNKNTVDLQRGEIMNMLIPYVLCELGTEYVVVPLMNFDIHYNDLKKYNGIIQKLPSSFDESMLYVNVLERFLPSMTLRNYIKNNIKKLTLKKWIAIMFLIIHSLFVITRKYPQFIHHNYNTQSLYIFDTQHKKTHIYKVLDKLYELPNNSIGIKLTHFESANISIDYPNKDAPKETSPIHDLMTLMKDLYHVLDELKYDNKEVIEFLESIIPKKYIGHSDAEYLGEITNVPTPSYLLLNNHYTTTLIKDTSSEPYVSDKNNFFLEFIQDNMPRRKQVKDKSESEEPVEEIEDEELEPTESDELPVPDSDKSATEESVEGKRGLAKSNNKKEDEEESSSSDEEKEDELSSTSSEDDELDEDKKKESDDELDMDGGSLSISDLSDSVKKASKKVVEVANDVLGKVGNVAEKGFSGMRSLFGEMGVKGQAPMQQQMGQQMPNEFGGMMSELAPAPTMSAMMPEMMQHGMMPPQMQQGMMPQGMQQPMLNSEEANNLQGKPVPQELLAKLGLPEKPSMQQPMQQPMMPMGAMPQAMAAMNAMPAMMQQPMMPMAGGMRQKKYKLVKKSGF